MFKKIFVISLLGIILLGVTTHALTIKEFSQKPLPNVVEFMDKALDWLGWFWSKIISFTNAVFNWTIDVFLTKLWKIIVWFWDLMKTGVLTGWALIDQIIKQLASGSGIDWQNIQWPWNEQ